MGWFLTGLSEFKTTKLIIKLLFQIQYLGLIQIFYFFL